MQPRLRPRNSHGNCPTNRGRNTGEWRTTGDLLRIIRERVYRVPHLTWHRVRSLCFSIQGIGAFTDQSEEEQGNSDPDQGFGRMEGPKMSRADHAKKDEQEYGYE
jgi:hypothetical protein